MQFQDNRHFYLYLSEYIFAVIIWNILRSPPFRWLIKYQFWIQPVPTKYNKRNEKTRYIHSWLMSCVDFTVRSDSIYRLFRSLVFCNFNRHQSHQSLMSYVEGNIWTAACGYQNTKKVVAYLPSFNVWIWFSLNLKIY